MEKTASLFGAPGRSDVWNANRHYCHFRRKYITLMMTIIASTELILIQTMCSSKLRMDSIHNEKHIMDRILLIRRVMLGAPSMWEIICKWSALWCCRVINKSSYQNEKWNFKNEEVSINLGHWWSVTKTNERSWRKRGVPPQGISHLPNPFHEECLQKLE